MHQIVPENQDQVSTNILRTKDKISQKTKNSFYQAKQVLQHQNMQLETRFMERISQHCEYFLLNSQEICSIELVAKL